MNNKQINTAIAEACGWDLDPIECAEWGSRQRWCKSPHGKIVFRHGIPDYCNDLNAMHEAEKKLTKKRLQTYLDFLADAPRDDVYQTWTGSVFATARQRAEAFLRTIGKWEGGPR